MKKLFEDIGNFGIIPAIKIEDAGKAVRVAKAFLNGGLPVLEITFRTSAAADAIREINHQYPDMLLGAGTILTIDQAQKAVEAGAKYLVSPGINAEILRYCADNDTLIIPGCSNPTDIELAISYGIDVVKFFPAEAFGGLAAMKSFSGPYPNIRYVPTGGIDEKNMADYLAYPKTLAVGGSWLAQPEIIKEEKFDEITTSTRNAVHKALGFEFAHIGIPRDQKDVLKIVSAFPTIFNFGSNLGSDLIFAGAGSAGNSGVEPENTGYVAIKTNNIKRAIAYLERQGIAADASAAKTETDNGKAVCLQTEAGGFAVHLLQR